VKLNKDDISGKIVKDNETYTVIDNAFLNDLVVSKTILHPGKATTGHNHEGQEEVYHFIHGSGQIGIGPEKFEISEGDIVLIPDGLYHRVWNSSKIEDLVFVCVFNGKRSH